MTNSKVLFDHDKVSFAYLLFLGEALLISLSGILAPGPLAALSVGKGSRFPQAGALVAVGHGMVELPLMLLILFGLGTLFKAPSLRGLISLLGGSFLLFSGFGMLRGLRVQDQGSHYQGSLIAAGAILSLSNPYFLLWWGTVGTALIMRSMGFGLLGFFVFAVAHWFCDLAWLSLLSFLSSRGARFLGEGFRRAVFALSGTFLLFFGVKFILDALTQLGGIVK
ncbi:MAG: hypothetical protein DRG31_06800 [Deltaproteobacteria bacterium]|nr:MAG: hypothetical protein DRG31_06800 [Deltaproteobacteria bacterium]